MEEEKLRVILVSPPDSPILSPVNERLKQVQSYEVSIPEDQIPNSIKTLPRQTVSCSLITSNCSYIQSVRNLVSD